MCYRCQEIQAISSLFLYVHFIEKFMTDTSALNVIKLFNLFLNMRHYGSKRIESNRIGGKHAKLFLNFDSQHFQESAMTFGHSYTTHCVWTNIRMSKSALNLTRITFKLTWRLRFYMPFVKSLYGNLSLCVVYIRFEVIKKMNCTTTSAPRNCIWSFNWAKRNHPKWHWRHTYRRWFRFFLSSCHKFQSLGMDIFDATKRTNVSLWLCVCVWQDYPFLRRRRSHSRASHCVADKNIENV